MANVISDETIEYVGILAKLELSDEEKEKAKADVLTPRLISEECSFIVETDNEKTYEILLPRLELKTRGILLQEGGPKYWIGKQITFYYRDDPSKPFHYDINERKAGSKDGKENPEI